MVASMALKKDHAGVITVKVVFWGPTLAGKTTALTIYKVLKSLEDPANVYKFLKLEDPTGRTLFFDQAIFGLGRNPTSGMPFLKYHVFTVPGQMRHKAQRKVVLEGVQGLVIVVDSDRDRWEENKEALMELNDLIGEKIAQNLLPYVLMLNKMDLPESERISPQEVSKLLVEAGMHGTLRDAHARIITTSCLKARDDLKELFQEKSEDELKDKDGHLKRELRPQSVQRIVKPVEQIIREIVVKNLT